MTEEKAVVINGKEVFFDPIDHVYICDDKFVPGVTSVLKRISKDALLPWASKVCSDHWHDCLKEHSYETGTNLTIEIPHQRFVKIYNEAKNRWRTISREAADIGTEVHKACEVFLSGGDVAPPSNKRVLSSFTAFRNWWDSHEIAIHSIERIIFHETGWYAGTCDFYGEIDGEECVLDFKTSAGFYPEYPYQLSAYALALENELGVEIPYGWIVRLDKKTGKFEARRYDLNEHARKAWYHVLNFDREDKRYQNEIRKAGKS